MYNVSVYDAQSEGSCKVGQYFRAGEFKCNDGARVILIAPLLVEVLDELRDYMGCPLIVTSGYRTPAYNKKVGGAVNSQHMYGVAADVYPADKNIKKLHAQACKLLSGSGGIGLYPTFVHVDVRQKASRWNG